METNCSCTRGLSYSVRRDIDRYVYSVVGDGKLTPGAIIVVATAFPGLWIMVLFRILHHLIFCFRPRILGKLINYPVFFVYRALAITVGIELDLRAHVGPGLFVNHYGGIIIGPVRIGENCDIFHGVTIGYSTQEHGADLSREDAPVLGNRVWVGTGAVVAGRVTVGNDAVIAANSLV